MVCITRGCVRLHVRVCVLRLRARVFEITHLDAPTFHMFVFKDFQDVLYKLNADVDDRYRLMLNQPITTCVSVQPLSLKLFLCDRLQHVINYS